LVSQYQIVSILDFIGAKDDGGGENDWSYKTSKVPVKLPPQQHNAHSFYRLDDLPVSQPTVLNFVKALKGN